MDIGDMVYVRKVICDQLIICLILEVVWIAMPILILKIGERGDF